MDKVLDPIIAANDAWLSLESELRSLKTVPPNLFHYTPNTGMIEGILERKELWLSPYDDLNDPSEIVHGLDLAEQEINEILPTLPTDVASGYSLFLQDLMKRDMVGTGSLRFYFMCFSEAGDQDISQWRAYANNGSGFCVNFKSKNAFLGGGTGQNLFNPIKPVLGIYPVIYDDAVKVSMIKKFLNLFAPFIASGKQHERELALSFIAQLCTSFKHPSYHPEKEWRHIQLSYGGRLYNTNTRTSIVVHGEHYREKLITSLPAQGHELDAIWSITCGPKQNHARYAAAKRKVQMASIGHHIDVFHSRIPMA